MARVEHKIYLEDSDDFITIFKDTETSKMKQKKLDKFDCNPIKDFITEINRKKFGHICKRCSKMNHCNKWQGKIILSCEDSKIK